MRFRAPTAVRFRESRPTRADRPARKPWVLSAGRLARRSENIAVRAVRAYRLARDREGFRLAVRSGGDGFDASSAPWGRRVGPSFSGARSPGAVPGGRRPLSKAVARRRGSLVTGPVDWPPVAFAAPDRSTGASLLRFRSHPFDVRWPRRAVRGCRPPDDPASAFVATVAAPKPAVASPLRFSCLASPLSDRTLCAFRAPFSGRAGGDAARAGHSCLVFFGQRTFRARARAWFSRPGRRPAIRFTGGVRGICSSPFAVLVRPRRG